MILDKIVKIRTNGKSIKYYRDLGYDCGYNTEIEVKIEHLLKGSNVIIRVACDCCGEEIYNVKYNTYNRVVEDTGNYVCENCATVKRKNTILKKYGVENVCYLEEVKQKKIITNLERYGVENPNQSNKIKEKIKKTNLERYGVENLIHNMEIKEKIIKTNLAKYGCESPFGSKLIQEKSKQSMLERYGVENAIDIPKTREKMVKTLYLNQSQKASIQQRYLCSLFNGELNFPIMYYNADICCLDTKIVIEYDGGGHMLNVTNGRETLEEYNRKQIIRDKTIKKEGYKQIRIISSKDYLPSDEILLKILEQSKEYFNTTDHTWVEYNIDTSLMRNAENKEGVFFDFGELRKIKKTG